MEDSSLIKGWNSWNHFGCRINETIVRQIADAVVATGHVAAGYRYGLFFPYTFPNGIPALIDYVHSRRLKLSLYSGA